MLFYKLITKCLLWEEGNWPILPGQRGWELLHSSKLTKLKKCSCVVFRDVSGKTPSSVANEALNHEMRIIPNWALLLTQDDFYLRSMLPLEFPVAKSTVFGVFTSPDDFQNGRQNDKLLCNLVPGVFSSTQKKRRAWAWVRGLGLSFLRSFHWNRTCTDIFVKLCLLIAYIIGTWILK